jgi:hypothetical protein
LLVPVPLEPIAAPEEFGLVPDVLVPAPLVPVLEPVASVAPAVLPAGGFGLVPDVLIPLLVPGMLGVVLVVLGVEVSVVVVVVVPMVPVELVPLVAVLPVGLVPAELEPVPEVCAAAARAAATSRLRNREKSLRCMVYLLSSFGTFSPGAVRAPPVHAARWTW